MITGTVKTVYKKTTWKFHKCGRCDSSSL